MILEKKFKIRESVDIYKIGKDILYFYFINKRIGKNIEVTEEIVKLMEGFTGNHTLEEILKENNFIFDDDLSSYIEFLLEEGILYEKEEEKKNQEILSLVEIERYERQITFFQEYFNKNPYICQKKLKDECILVFGCGAIGSGLAIELAMMGVKNFIFVDKGKIKESSRERHFYFSEEGIGKYKVEELEKYLKELNEEVKIKGFKDTINYDTSLDKYFSLEPTLVINTLDEPYIGITSLKIGRESYGRKIPMFVGGGFDGHLMSTGELIIPDITPCVDCYTNHFTEILKDWQPKYNIEGIDEDNEKRSIFEVGGLSSMGLFSISYGLIIILRYILGEEVLSSGRGELLLDRLEVNTIKIEKNKNCKICGEKNEI